MLIGIILKNNLVSIEPVSIDYLDDFHEYSTRKELYQFFEFDPFVSIDDSRRYLRKLIARSASNTAQYWFIKLQENNKVVGSIGLLDYDSKRKSVEMGYGVSPDYWGKGIFTSAALLLINYVFVDLGIHRVVAKTDEKNIASVRGLKKLNFKQEGLMRNYYRYNDGSWSNAVLFSKLATD